MRAVLLISGCLGLLLASPWRDIQKAAAIETVTCADTPTTPKKCGCLAKGKCECACHPDHDITCDTNGALRKDGCQGTCVRMIPTQ